MVNDLHMAIKPGRRELGKSAADRSQGQRGQREATGDPAEQCGAAVMAG
jgi:hypothetical protein